eukprot:gnl/MRDRNA2_/MRDRNA2_60132_c0_seq1.p1 gnl/MRDRNA2_/MRDRNA2_60132_c0~~gnl/MRDRNA2_/MRDRNA2_60132_c0_seq1.p1  ORF type:complete len:296 (-),score=49.55 gnl/MRDRNA2_/MRDRNA2_60132_c0_seq1:146-1033(-)
MDGEWQRMERPAESSVLALMREVFHGPGICAHLAQWDAGSTGPGNFQAFSSITLNPETGKFYNDVMPLAGYKKLASFDSFVEAWAEIPAGRALIEVTDAFAAGIGQWLKVAGGAKASVLHGAHGGSSLVLGSISLELGAFIGYTSTRLVRIAAGIRGPSGISLEIDPVHKYFARHFIDVARLSAAAEVWCGQARDSIPRATEELGCGATGFTFVDHSGSRFHEDIARLAAVRIKLGGAKVVADNVLKPGVPFVVWHAASEEHQPAAYPLAARRGMLWSVCEFMHDRLEDWMLVWC